MPDANNAFVELSKLTDYLLSEDQPEGKSKTNFFIRFGFGSKDFAALEVSLLIHAVTREVVEVKESPYGVKYVLACACESPDGRNPCIQTVWIVDEGKESPRLVTAYPRDQAMLREG